MASGISVLVGTAVGIAAGWYGGLVDRLLSRSMDVFLALPFLVFALALVAVVGPSLTISVTVIVMFSRITSYNVCYTKLLRLSLYGIRIKSRLVGNGAE